MSRAKAVRVDKQKPVANAADTANQTSNITMKKLSAIIVAASLFAPSFAYAGAKASLGFSYAPGTGSKSSSTGVRSYLKHDGTYVQSYRRSTPDLKFENNWSTKGNYNLYTGKSGTRVTPPSAK
jgi:hypothetical protein